MRVIVLIWKYFTIPFRAARTAIAAAREFEKILKYFGER